MKKLIATIVIIGLISSNLFAFDFTSFLSKTISPEFSKDSPAALNNMYKAHSWIHDTHKKEIEDLERIKRLTGALYIENKNLIFENYRLNELIFNYIKVKYTKEIK